MTKQKFQLKITTSSQVNSPQLKKVQLRVPIPLYINAFSVQQWFSLQEPNEQQTSNILFKNYRWDSSLQGELSCC